jgi:hypothetical protein
MKAVTILIQLFLFGTLAATNGPDKKVNCHFNQFPFEEFSNQILMETGVRIYYQEVWVSRIKVTLNADSITVLEAVIRSVASTNLKVSIWNQDLVLLPGENLLSELPSFKPKNDANEAVEEETKALTASEERYITGRKPDVVQTIRIGRSGAATSSGKAKILGRVLDQETGEPVYYATIFIQETKTGAVSDNNGFFTIMLKPGKYNAVFDFLGYENKKYLLEVLSNGNFTVNLKRTVFQIEEFVVHGDRQMSIKDKDAGLDKISMRSIKELPMMMGERDILKVSGTLPGIVTAGEGAAGLNVRGGGSDQNAFYINKIPIYNTSHLFGFFPAFNSDIIKDFSIYKGHIPAQYGGRLSSVFNIITRQGNRKNFTSHGGISPIAANIVVEGPIKKDTCSILLSARSTYSDWILKRIKDPTIRASMANFYDFSGAINYDIQKTQVSLFVYHSKDRFRLSDITDYNYSNSGISLGFSHNYSNSVRGEFALIGSQYDFSTIDRQEISSAYEHAYRMGHYEARADFTHILTNNNTLDYGIGFVLYQLDRGNVIPYGLQSLRNLTTLGKEQGLESSLYISDSYEPVPWINLTAGLRFTLFTPLGPKTVYTYTPGGPVDPRYINDTLSYAKNKPIRWYTEPDIRVAVNFETDEKGSIKLAFNQMHQNLFMLSNTISVAPNVQWKLADYHLKPSSSNQISLGVFRTLAKFGLEASAEVYYKRTLNYPEFKDGANFLESPQVETAVLQGKQKAYGIEFFLKRSNRRLEGWLTYTFSRSIVTINGDEPWNSINDGDPFPSNYDIPHVVNLVLNYHMSRRITFSTILTYQSGKPITYPVSVYYVDGVPFLDYSKRNSYRIPNYFRTDISVAFEGNLKKRKLLHSSLILSVYNLTGRENPYSVYFNTEAGRIKSYQYSVIGVPIFTATWIFKLGNYASD